MDSHEYAQYLLSQSWCRFAGRIKAKRKLCEKCAFPYELNVHHKIYTRLGNELDSDVVLLCKACHARHHFIEFIEDPSVKQTLSQIGAIGMNAEEVKARLLKHEREAKEKNLDRSHEIQINKEKQSD